MPAMPARMPPWTETTTTFGLTVSVELTLMPPTAPSLPMATSPIEAVVSPLTCTTTTATPTATPAIAMPTA